MNKTQLIDAVAKAANLKKVDAEAAVNAVTGAITDALKAGEKVQLIGFGTFETAEREARTGRNPATGEDIQIPASTQVKFKAGTALKEKVNTKPAKKSKKK